MDGLLLNTEDLYTVCTNTMLAKHGRSPLPWHIKAQLQGRPGPAAGAIFQEWAQLPIPQEQYRAEVSALQEEMFPTAQPLPGVERLLGDLAKSTVNVALATSSHEGNFKLKTQKVGHLFEIFESKRRVLGDDPRIAKGRGKPAPDIYLLALQMVNETLKEGEKPVTPEECLVFEDSVPGVESGRRAGMRVIWCPHPELKQEFSGKEPLVLAGRADGGSSQEVLGPNAADKPGEVDDGWAEYLVSLENFPYERYGIVIPDSKSDGKL